jgi:peptide/nickel transport system ATP-binding protein
MTASTPPALEVEHLSITCGGRLLVNSISLHVDRGESLAIVGESGSGKSLTARAIAGLLPSGLESTGSIRVEGRAHAGTRSAGPRVGLLMQDPFTMLNPTMTAGDHIAETLRAAGVPRGKIAGEVQRRLGEVGITDPDVAKRYPFELSGGMSQRVALASALAIDPVILLADEPTTALDATTQADVLELLRSIQRDRGMSLVFITHDLRVAFDLCDRVLVMYAGTIMEKSPAGAMRDEPLHPYTIGLLSSIPSTEGYQESLRGIPGSVPATHTVTDQCSFAARCDHRIDACLESAPALREVEPRRWAACIRIGDLSAADTPIRVHTPRIASEDARDVVLAVRDLSKSYRLAGSSHPALGGVSFDLRQGEALGIVGESGSGKTTIARCILGLTTPSSGTINFAGVGDVSGRPNAAQRRQRAQAVQCVFQDPYSTLNPMLSIGTTLAEALGQRVRPLTDREGEVAALLERVGLPASMAKRRPASLSGGQRQRVAIARAIAVEPRVLLCDEPVAALDVSVQAQILELLRDVNRNEGTSLLFITHDLGVVRQVTENVLVLYRGAVVETGPTDAVLDDPQDDYTRRLVAAMPSTQTRQEI